MRRATFSFQMTPEKLDATWEENLKTILWDDFLALDVVFLASAQDCTRLEDHSRRESWLPMTRMQKTAVVQKAVVGNQDT